MAPHFDHPMMVTLTIDPDLFEDAEAALDYCKKNRVVSRFVRKLRQRNLLGREEYLCVKEFQRNGMVHFHLLIDCKFLPFESLKVCWNDFRPKDAGPVKHAKKCECGGEGECNAANPVLRPGFGSVKISVDSRKKKGTAYAVNYLTKYLVKSPKGGWPDWVLDLRRNEPRYQVSRGFWLDTPERSESDKADDEDLSDGRTYYEQERDEWYEQEITGVPPEEPEEKPERPTIKQRVADCRAKAVVVVVHRFVIDGEPCKRTHFLGEVSEGFAECRERFGVSGQPFFFVIAREEVEQILGKVRHGPDETRGRADRSVGVNPRDGTYEEGGPLHGRPPGDRGLARESLADSR